MKVILVLMALLGIGLQFKLWMGNGSILQVKALKKEIANQQNKVKGLKERNQTLEAEVQDLKAHLAALEELARTDLGMIKRNETFYPYTTKENK